ncbi:MAG TPA: TonB-dependent receptor [Opitutaceae bacterium]|nr:TonB-dependent receptor [Opitutaceae bacterium]
MKLPLLPCLLSLATATLAIGADQAQTAPGATALPSFVVTGVPVDESVNPLTRESAAVTGDDRGPLDTPRGVSTITSGLFNERQIHGLQEILLYSPGAYAGAAYGNVTTPNLRGDIAETYLNGQRLGYNYYGTFPSFNGVEAVDLVRGPGSVVFGAGYFTGGYVNYVTKQPSFSGPETVVTTRVGTWAPGQVSFANGSVQIDTTAPVSDRLAWRVSYEAKGGDTFFRKNGARDDREDFFGAVTWRPEPGTTLEFNAQFFWQNAPETLGVNRVNQDLIDHGLYYTGISADNPGFPGPVPATGVVKLPWEATLFSRGDFSNANVVRAQAVLTHVFSPTLTLVNRTLFEYVNRRRFQQFEYAEYVTQHTFENRTELHFDWSGAALPQSAVAGVTVRYAGVVGYENYFNEYIYNFDVTDPSRVFSEAAQFPNSYYPGVAGPGGRPFFSASLGSPETADSRLWNPAVFWQQDLKLTSKLSLLAGVRGDLYVADARDALPPPNFVPWHDRLSTGTFSPSANLVYRPTPQSSLYATYQRIRSVRGSLAGGGLILTDRGDGTGELSRDDFHNRSDLAEVGAKFSLLDHKLFAAATAFDQQRTEVSLGGGHNDIEVRGLELESVYQPSTRLSATANLTLQEGNYVNSAPFQLGGRDIYAGYALGRGPGGLGTGTAAYNPYDNQVPVGNWPLVGFSHTLLNGSVRYLWENGFGAGCNAQWQSRQRGNLDDQWHIPAQVLYNASLFYEAKRWSANLDFLNLTNERNWIHNGDAYTASELIFPELPFRMEGYIKVKF